MPLKYRKNSTTYEIFYYDAADINIGDYKLAIHRDGIGKKYVAVGATDHPCATDWHVRINGSTYAVLKYGRTVSVEEEITSGSTTFAIPSDAVNITGTITLRGNRGGNQGGGGGGGGALRTRENDRSEYGWAAGGSGGSRGEASASPSSTEYNAASYLTAGKTYRATTGSVGSAGAGGGGGDADYDWAWSGGEAEGDAGARGGAGGAGAATLLEQSSDGGSSYSTLISQSGTAGGYGTNSGRAGADANMAIGGRGGGGSTTLGSVGDTDIDLNNTNVYAAGGAGAAADGGGAGGAGGDSEHDGSSGGSGAAVSNMALASISISYAIAGG